MSLLGIVSELNEMHVRTPRGCDVWGKTTVHNFLLNPVYAGKYVWGKTHQGRYFHCPNGQPIPTPRGSNRSERRPRDEWTEEPGNHTPLVDPELFEKVQRRLTANRARTSPSRKRATYPLSGLLICSHCGRPMHGTKVKSGGQHATVYRCGTNMDSGGCAPRIVRENVIIEELIVALEEKFLDPENLELLRAELRDEEEQQADHGQEVVEDLQKNFTRLDGQIKKARKNLLLLDPEDIPDAKAQIRQWEKDLADLQDELERATSRSPSDRLENLAGNVRKLIECVRAADPALVRSLIREAIERVDLRFDTVPKTKVTRYPFAGGEVHLMGEEECRRLVQFLSSSGPLTRPM